ncbi:MAG: phosphocholine cytidylyltransferase family protein [Candidatus Omnitrophica bacterium]|nr:phosphocholine cytidylyltransferase family protein [Candidatus Omnitrophota bacterium]
MKAVILAAGTGSRMGSLTRDKHKCMLEFLGKRIIDRQLGAMRAEGIEDIIVVAGHMADNLDCPGAKKVINERFAATNMVESFFCTRPLWDGAVMVSYGDIVYERKVLRALLESKDDISVVVDLNGAGYFRDRFGEDFLSETESMVFNGKNEIVDIGEPRPDISRVKGQYIGLLKFSKKGIDIISNIYDTDKKEYWDKKWLRSKNFQNGYMTDMLQRAIDLGHRVKAVPVNGGWLEFDSERDYSRYMDWKEKGVLDRYFKDRSLEG